MTRQRSRPPHAVSAPTPALRELLDDPIVHHLMEADGVTEADLTELIADVRQRLIAARWRAGATLREAASVAP